MSLRGNNRECTMQIAFGLEFWIYCCTLLVASFGIMYGSYQDLLNMCRRAPKGALETLNTYEADGKCQKLLGRSL